MANFNNAFSSRLGRILLAGTASSSCRFLRCACAGRETIDDDDDSNGGDGGDDDDDVGWISSNL